MSNWQELDERYIWHPYTQMGLFPRAIPVERADGSYLYLQNGQRLFDGISSWWVTLHGHAHPRISTAISAQATKLEQVIFAGFTHEPAATLAAKLIGMAPTGLAKVFFSDNGSTAVEVALKMAIQYWRHMGEERRTFLALEHAYHGDTFGAMSVSSRSVFTRPFEPMLLDVRRLPFPTPSQDGSSNFSHNEIYFLDELETECAKAEIAGFIYEPLLLGAGGMKVWRQEVLHQALAITSKHGILNIADEVLTGFGRTGPMWASEGTRSPDIMTLSKGITGGFLPLGATLASQNIFNAFLSEDKSKTFFHGHSYTGNPISCAAALASLQIFEEEPVMERIQTILEVHRERLPLLTETRSYSYRQLGTMAALEVTSSEGYLSNSFRDLSVRALERGLLVRPLGDVVYMLPPYSSSAKDLHQAYDILSDILP